MLEITSNGSKWAGELPDSLDHLLDVLENYTLDRVFEAYGNFIYRDDPAISQGATRFWGNFLNLSHVFSIDTDEPAIIERLTSAIRANQQTAEYLAQPDPAERQRAKDEAYKARLRKLQENREAEARAVLGIT